MQARAMTIAECDLPAPVPPTITALRCWARKASLAISPTIVSLIGVPGEIEVVDVFGLRRLGDGQLLCAGDHSGSNRPMSRSQRAGGQDRRWPAGSRRRARMLRTTSAEWTLLARASAHAASTA